MAALASLESLMMVTVLTALMWIPYIVSEMMSNGLEVFRYGRLPVPMHGWAQRAKVAHKNAIENLVVFFPIVFLCHVYEVPGVDNAAMLYFISRVLHWPACVFSDKLPYVRTICFFAGWCAIMIMSKKCLDKCNADKAAGVH